MQCDTDTEKTTLVLERSILGVYGILRTALVKSLDTVDLRGPGRAEEARQLLALLVEVEARIVTEVARLEKEKQDSAGPAQVAYGVRYPAMENNLRAEIGNLRMALGTMNDKYSNLLSKYNIVREQLRKIKNVTEEALNSSNSSN